MEEEPAEKGQSPVVDQSESSTPHILAQCGVTKADLDANALLDVMSISSSAHDISPAMRRPAAVNVVEVGSSQDAAAADTAPSEVVGGAPT